MLFLTDAVLSQYTFVREGRILWIDGVRTCVVLARSHVFPGVGEKDGIIRVDDLELCCAMQSDGNVGSKGTCVCVCMRVCVCVRE